FTLAGSVAKNVSSPSTVVLFSALRFSGRASVTIAIAPRRCTFRDFGSLRCAMLVLAELRLLYYITFCFGWVNLSTWPSFETRPAAAPQDGVRACCAITKLHPHAE